MKKEEGLMVNKSNSGGVRRVSTREINTLNCLLMSAKNYYQVLSKILPDVYMSKEFDNFIFTHTEICDREYRDSIADHTFLLTKMVFNYLHLSSIYFNLKYTINYLSDSGYVSYVEFNNYTSSTVHMDENYLDVLVITLQKVCEYVRNNYAE